MKRKFAVTGMTCSACSAHVEKAVRKLEGVDTVEEQIAIAKQKAGIPKHVKDVRLERFEVVRHF